MTSENNDSNVMRNVMLDPLSLNCSQGFFIKYETGRCSPTCSVLEELPHSVVVTFKVAFFLVNTLQFVGAFVAFAVSICNYTIM